MEVYFPDYPEKTSPVANDVGLLADSEDLDVDGKKKFKRYKLGNAESLAVQSLTYAALNTLLTASELVVGAKYLITDATTANISLIVEAIAVNKLSVLAEDVSDEDNVYLYVFAEDVIKGKIGRETLLIGTSTPMGDPDFSKFEIQYNQIPGFADTMLYLNDQAIVVQTFNTSAGEARAQLMKSRGSINAPSDIQNGDVLGSLIIGGRINNSLQNMVMVRAIANGTAVGDSMPTDLVLYVRKTGGNSDVVPDEALRISVNNSNVLFTGAIRTGRFTTTERNAFTGLIGGEIIFNTTTNKHQGYDGSTWNDMY